MPLLHGGWLLARDDVLFQDEALAPSQAAQLCESREWPVGKVVANDSRCKRALADGAGGSFVVLSARSKPGSKDGSWQALVAVTDGSRSAPGGPLSVVVHGVTGAWGNSALGVLPILCERWVTLPILRTKWVT